MHPASTRPNLLAVLHRLRWDRMKGSPFFTDSTAMLLGDVHFLKGTAGSNASLARFLSGSTACNRLVRKRVALASQLHRLFRGTGLPNSLALVEGPQSCTQASRASEGTS